MKNVFSILVVTCLLGIGACALTGCGSSSGTTDKMSDTKTGMEDKMMTGDKMTGDKMNTDKMNTDKMNTDKMNTGKMNTGKMNTDKMGH